MAKEIDDPEEEESDKCACRQEGKGRKPEEPATEVQDAGFFRRHVLRSSTVYTVYSSTAVWHVWTPPVDGEMVMITVEISRSEQESEAEMAHGVLALRQSGAQKDGVLASPCNEVAVAVATIAPYS